MAAATILNFQKFKILTFSPVSCTGPICTTVPNFIKIRHAIAEIWRFNGFFSKWRPSTVLNLLGAIGTTRDDHLVVSIVMSNLVKIDGVVSTTWNFRYFAFLAWKRLFTPPKWGFGCISPPKWGAMSTKPPRGTFLRESASFEPSSLKIRYISLYFTHLPSSPPWTDLHQIWHSRRGRRRNH